MDSDDLVFLRVKMIHTRFPRAWEFSGCLKAPKI